jgi:hypothetical protein
MITTVLQISGLLAVFRKEQDISETRFLPFSGKKDKMQLFNLFRVKELRVSLSR